MLIFKNKLIRYSNVGNQNSKHEYPIITIHSVQYIKSHRNVSFLLSYLKMIKMNSERNDISNDSTEGVVVV